MGARPTSFKKGGGFLDGVDVTFVDYQFTDEFNGEPFKPGKIKDDKGKLIDKPHNVNAFITFQVDGAEEPTTTTLKVAGNFDDWAISDDGHAMWDASYETIEEAEANDADAKQLPAGTAFAKFVTSFVEADATGQLVESLPEARIDYSALIGARIRTVQKTDAERTKKYGQKKSKNGKSYDRKDLVVEQIYSFGGEEPVAQPTKPAVGNAKSAPAKAATKATTATKAAPVKAKGKPAPAPEPEFDLDAETSSALKEVLQAAGGSLKKGQLSMKLLNARMQHPEREAIRKRVFDDEFLASVDGVSYDKAKGTVTLDEVAAEA